MTRPKTKRPGKRGGARRGAGRKRGLDPTIFIDLGPPPLDGALQIGEWAQRCAARLVTAVMTGKVSRQAAQEIRASLRTLLAALPAERMAEVHELIRKDAQWRTDARTTVPMEPASATKPLHGVPARAKKTPAPKVEN